MFVRTRPKDKARIVVTKREADLIDEEWSIVSGTHDVFMMDRAEIETEAERLRQRFQGKEPAENDIKWGILNKQLTEHAKKGDWGLYRNTTFAMAELLRKEARLKQALHTYFEVCYLDLNGPRNLGGLRNSQLLGQFPPFDPNDAFLAPGVLDIIRRIAGKLPLGIAELGQLFIEHNERVGDSMRLPRSANQCWTILQKQLQR